MKKQYHKIELSCEAVLYEARHTEKEKSDSKKIEVGVIGQGQVCSRYFNIMFQLRSWEVKSLLREFNVHQHSQFWTHRLGVILDLVFNNECTGLASWVPSHIAIILQC